MISYPQSALGAYRHNEVEAAVFGASSVQLIVLLYDGALIAMQRAKGAMQQSNYALKASMISKAAAIVSALRDALDLNAASAANSEIGTQLCDLYLYIERQLLDANRRNEPKLLDESHRLLSTLREAWDTLAKMPLPVRVDSPQNHAANAANGATTISYGKV